MACCEIIGLIFILIFVFYKWATYNYDYFEKRGIPHDKPAFLIGNILDALLKKKSFFDIIKDRYMKFSDKPLYGLFEGRYPRIVVRDIGALKKIMVKDFEHFVNHKNFIDPEDDALFGNSLLMLKDQKWKDMRTILSPAFTGSKMRLMFQLISECCEEAKKVATQISKDNPNGIALEMKDFYTKFTNDAIASCAFGLKIDSITGKNSEFYEMAQRVTNFNFIGNLKFILTTFCKPLMRILKIRVFDPKSCAYFTSLVLDTMKYRIENDIHRPDMIDILIEARKLADKSLGRKWTDDEIVAQCFIFFFAGFESTATSMCFASHELMENPECQEKLYEEIKEVEEKLRGQPLTYEALNGMKYMEMVMQETLRKWPSIVTTDRMCTKAYRLEVEEFSIDLKPGDVVAIPITGLHYDEEYFPNPKQFDPERFIDGLKGDINQIAYCPFGVGPRNCIGSRLALMESKAILFYMLKEFKFEKSEKTQIPIQLRAGSFQLVPTEGFWLKLQPRHLSN